MRTKLSKACGRNPLQEIFTIPVAMERSQDLRVVALMKVLIKKPPQILDSDVLIPNKEALFPSRNGSGWKHRRLFGRKKQTRQMYVASPSSCCRLASCKLEDRLSKVRFLTTGKHIATYMLIHPSGKFHNPRKDSQNTKICSHCIVFRVLGKIA
jgi:hypothetical protein